MAREMKSELARDGRNSEKGLKMRINRLLPLTALVALAAACADSNSGDGGGTTVPPGQLTFIRLPATAPALCADTVQFWAKRGVGIEGALEFPELGEPADCSGSTEDFVRLKLDAQSLLAYPNGTLFQPGDSVLITLAWVGNDSILVHLEPTGLLFDPAQPAELKIEYAEVNGDFDDDGDVDADDDSIEQQIDVWRQPTLVDNYTKVGTAKFEDNDEIEARLNGFSRYALAY